MNLNPFDWQGPAFLGFYTGLMVVGFLLAWLIRRSEGKNAPPLSTDQKNKFCHNPYAIAYLRAGPQETIKTAIVSLLDRKLLKASGDAVRAAATAVSELALHPLEKSVLTRCKNMTTASLVLTDPVVKSEVTHIGSSLERQQLIPDLNARFVRKILFLFGLVFFGLVAGMKIHLAWSRNHHNIGFLIILSIMAPIILYIIVHGSPRMPHGDEMLDYVQTIFENLKKRSETSSSPGEAWDGTYLMAVYGAGVLPAPTMNTLEQMRLKTSKNAGGSSSWGSGCSIGSSCSSGSSCGGGGCGGGCGGCGS